MAYELTKLVHGEEEAKKAQDSCKSIVQQAEALLICRQQNLQLMTLTDGEIDIMTMLVKAGLVPSKSEARRAVQQGGVAVDGEKVTDIHAAFKAEDMSRRRSCTEKRKEEFP